LHDEIVQVPPVQVAVPFATVQAVPHAPQFAGSVWVLTHTPLQFV